MKNLTPYLLTGIIATSLYAAAPDQVKLVQSGKVKEARASWWGFDTEDSTTTLQTAINSGVPRLIIDKQQSPWVVNKTLKLVSNQEIIFEDGVEVLAGKGAFKGRNDSLVLLSSVSNVTLRGAGTGATLRMRRADYDAAPYVKAEWRHVLSIRGCQDIKVYNLTLAESGGDGIYLGTTTKSSTNKDVHIKDVICDKNYRQGISVISAENLLIEDTIMRDTAGTAPAAGIDFEPNKPGELLKNIVMRRCLTSNNAGDGYEIYLPYLSQQSEPVSILIEGCKSVGDQRKAVRMVSANSDEAAVRGTIVFKDCEFKDAVNGGIQVTRKPEYGVKLVFDRCTITGCAAEQGKMTDVMFSTRNGDDAPVGGIQFKQLHIVQPYPRPWITWLNNIFEVDSVTGLTGDVVVTSGSQTQRISLTPEWVKAQFPSRFKVRVPRMKVEWEKLRVKDELNGLHPLEPMRMRSQGIYLFYATAAQEVVLKGTQHKVGARSASQKPLLIKALDGKTLKSIAMPGFKQEGEVQFTAPQTGLYRLEVDVGGNSFMLESANVPVAFDATSQVISLLRAQGTLHVCVPKEAKLFAFAVEGTKGEGVKASVIDPSGSVVWVRENLFELDRFTFSGSNPQSGLWQIKLEPPESGWFEDYSVDVLGVPGFLFLNPKRSWQ